MKQQHPVVLASYMGLDHTPQQQQQQGTPWAPHTTLYSQMAPTVWLVCFNH